MAQPWNRNNRRKMSRYGLGQKMLQEELDNATRTARENASEYAFAACFLALHRLHGFSGDQLHELAVAALRIINKSLCASDVVKKVKELTGFDVHQQIPEDELDPLDLEDDTMELIFLDSVDDDPGGQDENL